MQTSGIAKVVVEINSRNIRRCAKQVMLERPYMYGRQTLPGAAAKQTVFKM